MITLRHQHINPPVTHPHPTVKLPEHRDLPMDALRFNQPDTVTHAADQALDALLTWRALETTHALTHIQVEDEIRRLRDLADTLYRNLKTATETES
jgi:hypothetical protein